MNRFQQTLLMTALAIAPLSGASAQNLKDFGSFHIGGRQVTLSGYPVTEAVFTKGAAPTKIDPNGDFEAEQMYVQYLIPVDQKGKFPLLLWHGGGLTGVTYETKPDGQPGWEQFFFRAGHAVYLSDAVERGRSGWSRYPEVYPGVPIFRTKKEAWELFRIGPPNSYDVDPTKRVAHPGTKFPINAFDQFTKQSVPRWTGNDAITLKAYGALLQKVGPAIVLVHSQAGNFGFNAALNAPDKVKGLIAVEPAGAPPPGPELDKLKNIPILIVWGDRTQEEEVWKRQQPASLNFYKDLKERGANIELIELPKIGITGNTHMMMMDTNSDQIAGLIQDWMKRKGLSD